MLTAFPDAEVDAVFAHELAHVSRRDGLWFLLIGVVEELLWIQPLNRCVARRCRHTAELAADDRAVEVTGSPRMLARAITRMAHASLALASSKLTPEMAATSGMLVQRVQRLVESEEPLSKSARSGASEAPNQLVPWFVTGLFIMLGWAVHGSGVAIAAPPASASHREGGPRTGAQGLDPPDQELEDIVRQTRDLEDRMQTLQASSYASEPEQQLQREQDLRHITEMQAWVARRLRTTEADHPR